MTYLSRLTQLGGAKETTQGTYVVPTFSIPWNSAEYVDVTEPLRDESVRANDSVVQGIQAGPKMTNWAIGINNYADILGHFLVAMGLFDTVSAGVSTTLASNSAANAATLSLTASVPNNSILKITDAAGANLEYVKVGTVTGAGPYSAPITTGGGTGGNTTLYAHTAAGGSVVSQSTHTFKQNRTFSTVWPSYSFTTSDGVDILGWAGCVAQELAFKIDPKGLVAADIKYTGWPSATQPSFSYAASTVQPVPGWAWSVTNAGATSTRGLTMDWTLKRTGEAIHASTGLQAPREVFAGALESDGAYKAIFENDTDRNLFLNYTQTPTVHTLTQPVLIGGAILTVTMSVSGYTTAKVANTQPYLQLDLSLTGIQNATDGGVSAVTLTNYSSSAF